MNLILFGYKRCGKTHFGTLLAKELKRPFIDTDDLIELFYERQFHERLSCRQIAQKRGEELFRALEREAIFSIQEKNAVISVGGGAILDLKNCEKLKSLGKLVYLEADKETIKSRIFQEELPSYLDAKDPEGSFERMYEKRKPLYEKIEAVKVSTSKKTQQDILNELKRIIHG